jgi:hypothetical protein
MELFLCMFTLLIYYIIKFALMLSSKNVFFVCSFHFIFNADINLCFISSYEEQWL